MDTNSPPKTNVVVVMVGILDNNTLRFEFLFTPGGPEPGQVVSSLYQYLTSMIQRKQNEPSNS